MFIKSRKLVVFTVILLIAGIGIWLNSYLQIWTNDPLAEGEVIVVDTTYTETPLPRAVEYEIVEFARNLYVPWSIEFTSNNRMLVTERNGAVRVIENGNLHETPLYEFANISTTSEEGLMGMVKDPQYDSNSYLYFCYAYPAGSVLYDKVVRMRDTGQSLADETTLLDAIPAAKNHAGCRLKFGPDGKLYITTGDATDRQIAQDTSSLGGKILRINADGTVPEDNPFGNEVWSYGHRNPQGIAWHTSGTMYETEHGPSGFDGPGGGDEVNVITRGSNYGWPLVSHEKTREGTESPKLVFTPAFAPASGMFYTSDILPQFTNNFFFGGLRGEGIMRVIVSEDGLTVTAYEKLPRISYGRIREIAEGPDGFIYFTTSNRDGRGTVREGDDKIFVIKPVN